ncbi:sugar phosphate isomerase/epimerase [bacterium]|nr:sugar phosphate isomerase/epimerase [bacterium]
MQLNRRDFLAASLAMSSAPAFAANAKSFADPFFIMDTWYWFAEPKPPWPDRLAFLKSQGVNAICFSLGSGEERWQEFLEVAALTESMDVELVTVYVAINIDNAGVSPLMQKVIDRLKGRKSMLHVPLTSKAYKQSDPAGDAKAIEALKRAAEISFASDLPISLYPHVSNWGERASDMARLAAQINDPRLRITLNQYHWLKVEGPGNLEKTIENALPYLNCVTINGSMKNAKDIPVRDGILPLGKGDYDTLTFAASVKQAGYKGPVGVQGYGIDGDVTKKIAESLAVWKAWNL